MNVHVCECRHVMDEHFLQRITVQFMIRGFLRLRSVGIVDNYESVLTYDWLLTRDIISKINQHLSFMRKRVWRQWEDWYCATCVCEFESDNSILIHVSRGVHELNMLGSLMWLTTRIWPIAFAHISSKPKVLLITKLAYTYLHGNHAQCAYQGPDGAPLAM